MTNLFDLTGKIALVTGASGGLGAQTAKALAGQGADIAICARRVEKLEQIKKEIEDIGARCFVQACDVLKVEDIQRMVKNVADHYGRIDILVNNAGVADEAPAEELTTEAWRHVLGTNLDAAFYVAREVGKLMIQNGYGKIINMGSIHSEVCIDPSSWPVAAYCASKGGVKMLTKALAVEWADKGITVNAIGPSHFRSEMTGELMETPDFDRVVKTFCPMGRPGQTGELDGAVIYFASDASSYTTGQLLCIDGGWTAV